MMTRLPFLSRVMPHCWEFAWTLKTMFLTAIFYSAEISLTKTKGGGVLHHNYVGGAQALTPT